MKRVFSLLLCACIVLSLAACGAQSEQRTGGSSSKTVDDLIAEDTTAAPTLDLGVIEEPDVTYPSLDYAAEFDLTVLGSDMVYAVVNDMMTTPDKYIGRTVKASGTFAVYTDINTGAMYYACLISDALACCSSGLEFTWKGDHSFPEDYPDEGAAITIGGEFETYQEGDATYCRLKNAEFVY